MSHDDSCQPGTQAKPGVHAAELPTHLAVRAWHPWRVTARGMLTGLSSSCRQADVLGQVQQASFTADVSGHLGPFLLQKGICVNAELFGLAGVCMAKW